MFTAVFFVVAAFMATYTLGVILNAFFQVFVANILRRVFVAAIAGIAAVLATGMTNIAARIVIAIEGKILVMVKSGGFPLFQAVASGAIIRRRLVQFVVGLFMAAHTVVLDRRR